MLQHSTGSSNNSADGIRMTTLANDEAVESVVYDEGGVLASLTEGTIHICASTISVALSRRLSQSHALKGQRYVAAPALAFLHSAVPRRHRP
ncbi:NAD(P)-binding domain-containing protein [Pseudomonas mandelii]|uniref:NAD(P)-binding domain-containing protein n=1 Tax=Pseudomonas mandelii TaxID=75612 RepID=UPI00345F3752